MAAQQSTPTEILSEKPPTAVMIQHLDLATKTLRQCQEMTSENAPVPLQFNDRQCRYLVTRLETVVQSAKDSMQLSSPEEKSSVYLENWKYLVRLAMDVLRLIQDCCENEYWIQAANMLIDAYEHVVSLDGRLELCIWSFRNSGRIMLGTALRQDLMNISKAQEHRPDELVDLLMKAGPPKLEVKSFLNFQGRELAITLIRKLEAALDNNRVSVDQPVSLAELSLRDQVELLKRVELALSSGSISSPEERQMASSLAERFLVSVVDPLSIENIEIDFMRVNCKSLEPKRGLGSSGEVYEVQWLGSLAAQKVFLNSDQSDESFRSIFDKEVLMSARQSHPNIVRLLCYVKDVPKLARQSLPNILRLLCFVKDVPKENQIMYSMVQELMQKDLEKLIDERMPPATALNSPKIFPFSRDEVVDILLQIAEGMDYLHRRGVLHRDLKSQNILVKCEEHEELDSEYILAKVADFGISKTKEKKHHSIPSDLEYGYIKMDGSRGDSIL